MQLQQTFDSLRRDIGRALFGGNKRDPANWSSDDIQDVEDILRDGYAMLLVPQIDSASGVHKWHWQRPIQTLPIWNTQTGTLSASPVQQASTSLVTASTGSFYETMIGYDLELVDGNYEITSYVSATQVVVAGNASGNAGASAWTVTADGDYALPEEVIAIDGNMTFQRSENSARREIIHRDEMDILAERQVIATGSPMFFAMTARTPFDATAGQRWRASFYPTPDRVYNVKYRATIAPDVLTAVNKYALGGFPYSRCLKEAALACVELQHSGTYGPHYQSYLLALSACVDFDRKSFTPESVGPNVNIGPNFGRFPRHDDGVPVTYNS